MLSALLSLSIFFLYATDHREKLGEEIRVLAKILAFNEVAPLQFNDMDSAKAILTSVQAENDVHRAYLLDNQRNVLVQYRHMDSQEEDDSAVLQKIQHQQAIETPEHLFYALAVRRNGETLGILVLKTSFQQLMQRYQEFAVLLVLLLLFSVILAVILSNRLQGIITKPIKSVENAAAKVALGDLDAQVDVSGNLELAKLSYHFNLMVSSLKESTVSKSHLDNVIASMPDALFLLHEDLTISNCNPVACYWTGKRAEELMGLTLFDLLEGGEKDNRKPVDDLRSALLTEGHFQPATCLVKGDEKSAPLSFSASALKDKGFKTCGYVCIGRDISERVNYENQLQQALITAQMANEAKSTFLSRMSHELRTPLNAILGFAQLQMMSMKKPEFEQFRQGSEEILHAGYHLLNLINDILDLVRVEQNQLKIAIEACGVDEAVVGSLKMVESLLAEHKVQVHYESTPCQVLADFTRLKQVIINLLSNAIKYNKPQGQVWLKVLPLQNDIVRFEITDEGIGIKPEEISLLFKPFSRLPVAQQKEIPGTGIGLSLCRFLVEQMGGHIGVESEPNKGSTFWFELEASEMKSADIVEQTGDLLADTLGEGCVLYIEDNPSNQLLMKSYFDSFVGNLRLLVASSGEEGIAMAKKHRPGLVFVDINLPKMSGLEVVQHLRRQGNSRKMRLVALSADAMTSQIDLAMSSGFDNYITKPLKLTELNQEIESVFLDL